jgi:hypothetical protein
LWIVNNLPHYLVVLGFTQEGLWIFLLHGHVFKKSDSFGVQVLRG